MRDGSSSEVDELKAKLISAKETSQGEIKVREEVWFSSYCYCKIFK